MLCCKISTFHLFVENCPHHNPSLRTWKPGHDPNKAVVVHSGQHYSLTSSATLYSITIKAGGKIICTLKLPLKSTLAGYLFHISAFLLGSVVFDDDNKGSKNITLRTRHILVEDGGALHIGAPKCRYRSLATITLVGRSDETSVTEVPGMGRKFLGVNGGGTLELHGSERLSWTLLTRTVPSSGLATSGHAFHKNFSRGINLRVVDQDTAEVLHVDRYDTHEFRNESKRLSELLKNLTSGRIVALAIGDSAVKSLLDETKRTIQDVLGSTHVNDLKYR